MIHTLGKCCLLLGCVAFGGRAAVLLQSRTTCLQGFVSALEQLERELSFSLTPLPELFGRLAREGHGAVQHFFSACVIALEERGEARYRDIWCDTLAQVPLPLQRADIELLREVGGILGQYDGDNQEKALQALRHRLEESRQKSKEEAERLGKVYVTLGVTFGLFCMILL